MSATAITATLAVGGALLAAPADAAPPPSTVPHSASSPLSSPASGPINGPGNGPVNGPAVAAAQPHPVSPEIEQLAVPAAPQSTAELSAPPAKSPHAAGPDNTGDSAADRAGALPVVAELSRGQTDGFRLVGVTWSADRQGRDVAVRLRVRHDGGWTAWRDLAEDEDGAGTPTRGTPPLWVGTADGIQVKVATSDGVVPRDLRVQLVDPGTSAADAGAPQAAVQEAAEEAASADAGVGAVQPQAETTAGDNVPTVSRVRNKPAIISRAGWGADESLRSFNGQGCTIPTINDTIRVAFVHHTAGSNSYAESESRALVRGIYAYHVRGRGWCDIGYNYLVDKYGNIFEGRFGGQWLPVQGAHTLGHNDNSFGVSLMGNFETAQPTNAIMESTAQLIAWRLQTNYRDPLGTVVHNGDRLNVISGHRDTKATACPGRYVYERMGWLRNRVKQLTGSPGTPIYREWQRRGGESGWIGSPYAPERNRPGGGARTWFAGADIFQPPGTQQANVIHGAIRVRYRQMNTLYGRLGWPKRDQTTANYPGSQVGIFERGRIYWSQASGPHEVYGDIYHRYMKIGGSMSRLSLPTSGVQDAAKPGTRRQLFQRGRFYWTKATGGWEVYGDILDRYLRIGGTGSRVGVPVSGVQDAAKPGTRRQLFDRGRYYWTKATGGWEMYGDNLALYLSIGGTASRVGVPVSGVFDGDVPGLRRQDFTNGRIYWGRVRGSRDVSGPILDRYVELGAETGRLGLPDTGQFKLKKGDRVRNRFVNGTITWNKKTGKVRVRYF